jgi:hypothetical protein
MDKSEVGVQEPRKLGEVYRANKYRCKLIERTETTAIYARVDQPTVWEVFKIKVKEARTFPNGKSYPRREVKPRNEDFGYTAWCFTSGERAFAKFKQISVGVGVLELL